MSREWSSQQVQIFEWFAKGQGNLVVRARAGTGKTTTIMEAVNHAPEGSILLAAFNKRIATELQARLAKAGAEAKTLHSVGFGFVRRFWGRVQIDNQRGYKLAQRACGEQAPDEMIALTSKLAALGKSIAPLAQSIDPLVDIAIAYDKLPDDQWEEDGWTGEKVARCALDAMQMAKQRDEDGERIDFDDMVYLPIANGWTRPLYDLVCVDEAQDMNPVQLLLARACARGRIAVIGDDRQAIYGFRGADSNAIDNLKRGLSACELGLTVTYRCAQSIVAHAAKLVPDFAAHPTNAVGEISAMTTDEMQKAAEPGDFVLSRKNAPLAGICLGLLRAGKRARIEGKDIGAQLASIIKARKAKGLPALEEKICRWRDNEITKARKRDAKAADARAQLVTDQAETILALAEGCMTVPELVQRIESLFGDSGSKAENFAIVCSSIHKSKGLEAERVFVLVDTLYPGGDRSKIEEQNLEYVACTRAKRTLVWVK